LHSSFGYTVFYTGSMSGLEQNGSKLIVLIPGKLAAAYKQIIRLIFVIIIAGKLGKLFGEYSKIGHRRSLLRWYTDDFMLAFWRKDFKNMPRIFIYAHNYLRINQREFFRDMHPCRYTSLYGNSA